MTESCQHARIRSFTRYATRVGHPTVPNAGAEHISGGASVGTHLGAVLLGTWTAEIAMPESELVVERQDAILTVTFNRPAERNALSQAMLEGLKDTFTSLNADQDVRVV